jgi:hypothetical protein
MMEDTRDSYVRERRVFVNDATNSQCESCLYEVGLRPDPLEKLKISCVKKVKVSTSQSQGKEAPFYVVL